MAARFVLGVRRFGAWLVRHGRLRFGPGSPWSKTIGRFRILSVPLTLVPVPVLQLIRAWRGMVLIDTADCHRPSIEHCMAQGRYIHEA